MTALESADEMEAITAITFLLSLVIKRYRFETCTLILLVQCNQMKVNLQMKGSVEKGQ